MGSWLSWCRDNRDRAAPAVPGWTKHLGEAGASLVLLMAKSRHKKPENLRRYFKPSGQALAEITSLLAPGDSRR
ncbi:hypothetical protein [Saccharopolyspora cebuensis]|uniref:Uncharacterized protein n=1 Tax=Saccharopolyspora cebuensis TaxID=418759 RepID=A0ABV4CA81_9PSEU